LLASAKEVGADDQRVGVKLLKSCEGFVDLAVIAGIYDLDLMAGHRSGGPDIRNYSFGERIVRIDEDGHQNGFGHEFVQQPELLRAELARENGGSGDIAARTVRPGRT
jgi:hypothetical protein